MNSLRVLSLPGVLLLAVVVLTATGCNGSTAKENLAAGPNLTGPPTPKPGPEDPDAPKEFSTTESGLKYRILRRGTGKTPTPANTFVADYRGWLDDGTEFDNSYKRRQPLELPMTSVVPGWTEGLQLISQGGMIELKIPPELGYGKSGQGPIPGNSNLNFVIELHDVK